MITSETNQQRPSDIDKNPGSSHPLRPLAPLLRQAPQGIKFAPDCRVVILTVFEDEKKISDSIRAGACGYLLKTAMPDDIVEAIHEAANGGSPMSPAIASSVVKLF